MNAIAPFANTTAAAARAASAVNNASVRPIHRPYRTRSSANAVVSEAETTPDVEMELNDNDNDMSMQVEQYVTDRRSAMVGLSAGLAATIAQGVTLPLFGAKAAEDAPKKRVAVPYTPYQVQSDSTPESIEAAKALTAAGARLYGAFWCENCNKQKELLGKQAMEYINYVECYPNGVYQNVEGKEDVIKPVESCNGYSDAWPLWVVPKSDDLTEEIGIQGQVKKPKDLLRLVKEARGEKFDPLGYWTKLEFD